MHITYSEHLLTMFSRHLHLTVVVSFIVSFIVVLSVIFLIIFVLTVILVSLSLHYVSYHTAVNVN